MEFNWQEAEKEKFYREAERQLEEAGIDFIGVDRRNFGVRGWNGQEKTAQAVLITLSIFPYNRLNSERKNMLKRMVNWECTDKFVQGEPRPIYMHSRLAITETGRGGLVGPDIPLY